MKSKHWTVFILLGLIWSSSFLWIKIGVQEIGPMALVAFRMLFGAITAVAIATYQRVEWPRDRQTWLTFAILGPTSLATPIFFISWGEQTIDSAVASILNATVPLFTIVIAHFLLHDDRMTVQKVLGLLIGFAGVVVLLSGYERMQGRDVYWANFYNSKANRILFLLTFDIWHHLYMENDPLTVTVPSLSDYVTE